MSGDPINHPLHYTSSPARCKCCDQPIECIDVTEHLPFCIRNVIKYLWRADHKGDPIENLEKGLWYLTREIQRRKQQQARLNDD